MVAKCGPTRTAYFGDLISSCRVRSARSPRRLSSVTERIPAQAVSRAPSPVPPRPPGAKARSPRATPLPKGAQPGSRWPCARSNPGRLLGGRDPGCPWGWQGARGWLFFLPPNPYPNLSEAHGVLEAGSRPDAPLWPKEVQGQSALSTVIPCSSGTRSGQCGSAAGLGGPPEGVWPGVRRPGFPVLWPPCLTSLDPLRPLRKMGKSRMSVTSYGGPPRGQETELKNDLFPLNVHSSRARPPPPKLPAWVPKEAGQGGVKAERSARQVTSSHSLFKKLF